MMQGITGIRVVQFSALLTVLSLQCNAQSQSFPEGKIGSIQTVKAAIKERFDAIKKACSLYISGATLRLQNLYTSIKINIEDMIEAIYQYLICNTYWHIHQNK